MADKLLLNPKLDYGTVALAALALGVVAYVYGALASPLAKIPGPWYSNWTGLVLKKHWLAGRRAKYVQELHEKYGPIVRIGPGEVDVTDIPSLKEIHTVKATYVKDPAFYTAIGTPGQENLFNTVDIQFHRRHRKLLSGGFSETSLKSYHPLVEGRVDLAIQRIGQEMETRGAADVFKWWLFLATDVIGELSFGESFKMLERGEKNEYTLNLERTAAIAAKRVSYPTFARLAFYGVPIPGFADNTEVSHSNKKYATELLGKYQRRIEQQTSDKPVPTTLFTKLFQGLEEETLPFHEIRDEAQIYVVAGSDTTALTLTYLTWRVCRTPSIREKLVEELKTNLPEGEYGDSDLQKLPYFNQVIEEALRLYPAVPSALPRLVPPEGATFSGYYVPGGSTVCTQAYSLHRNPEIFPRPEEFDPSRWAAPTKAMKDSFMPFGGGSRVCIGLHLARLELRLAVARFFLAFPDAQVSTLEGMSDDDMEMRLYFLGTPKRKRCLISRS